MFEFVKNWFLNHGFAISIIGIVSSFHTVVGAIQVCLEKVDQVLLSYASKNQTAASTEIKLSGFIGILATINSKLQTALDWVSGNRAH